MGGFQDGGAEAAIEGVFLGGDTNPPLLDCLDNWVEVQRTQEPGVDHAHIEAVRPQLLSGLGAVDEHRAKGQEDAVLAQGVDFGH